ncbi:MAG: hypothetical protein ACR2OE_11015 [Thermomicrobiales bacterium]
MAAKKSPFAGMNLSEQVIPERSVGRDQRLFQGSARQPANHPTSQTIDQSDSQPVDQPTSQQVSKPKSARQSYPKRTYHLNPETVTLLEDMQRTLKRTYGVKRPLMEEIVEIAVAHLNADLEENQRASHLVSKLTS